MTASEAFHIRHDFSQRFSKQPLDDELALFDTLSGETHLISSSAVAVLDLLNNSAKTRDMLCQEMAPYVAATEQEIRAFIDQTIDELQKIGLLEIEDCA